MSFLTFLTVKNQSSFPDITYSFYDVWADLFQIPYERPELDEHFHIKKKDYFHENGGIIFPNPNAPDQVSLPLDEIEEIILHNQDVIVIVDETYIDFGTESAFPRSINTRICWSFRHFPNQDPWQVCVSDLQWEARN